MGSDHLDRDVYVNFIKTIFQILHNDVIDQVQFSNCVCKYQMFLQKKPRTSNFFQITCPGTSRTFQYFHIPDYDITEIKPKTFIFELSAHYEHNNETSNKVNNAIKNNQ